MLRNVPALWLCLLPPDLIERLEGGDTFDAPHPDFPDVVDLFYFCTGCKEIHWQPTRFLLHAEGGHLCFAHQRQLLLETESLRHLYTDEEYARELERARQDPTPVRRREACTHMTPTQFTERTRLHLRGGECAYLEQVRATGKDPSRYLGGEEDPAHLKVIANAELNKRLLGVAPDA